MLWSVYIYLENEVIANSKSAECFRLSGIIYGVPSSVVGIDLHDVI